MQIRLSQRILHAIARRKAAAAAGEWPINYFRFKELKDKTGALARGTYLAIEDDMRIARPGGGSAD
jgi:hypothetical protein